MGVAADEKGREEKGEQAMVAGILEGSPEAVGVAVVRLDSCTGIRPTAFVRSVKRTTATSAASPGNSSSGSSRVRISPPSK